jgi:hypothetical protein
METTGVVSEELYITYTKSAMFCTCCRFLTCRDFNCSASSVEGVYAKAVKKIVLSYVAHADRAD